MDTDKKYIIKNFNTNQQCEDAANELWPAYRCLTITDTNAYITALFERNDGDD